MQRKPIFPSAQSAAADTERGFLGDVFRAVMDHSNDTLVSLLRRPGAARALQQGFQANSRGTERACFTALCVSADNIGALRAVLEAKIPGITLAGCSEVERTWDGVTVTVPFDFPASCVDRGDADGLALALAFDSAHRSFTGILADQDGTLHYGALVRALQGADRQVVQGAALCCQAFAQHGAYAPCISEDFGDKGLRRLFVMGRYDDLGNADLVLPLLRCYIEAGLFDIDAPMEHPFQINAAHRPPLQAAIECGNAALSGALIDLGCDLEAARGEYPDVIALAASHVTEHERGPQTHAAVVEAMMRRRLGEQHAEAAESKGAQAPMRRVRAL